VLGLCGLHLHAPIALKKKNCRGQVRNIIRMHLRDLEISRKVTYRVDAVLLSSWHLSAPDGGIVRVKVHSHSARCKSVISYTHNAELNRKTRKMSE